MNKVLLIARKEIKTFFDHPAAYILIIAFLAVNNYFYFKDAYLAEIASLRPMFDILPWLLMFFVPAVTMRSIAAERREKTFELIITKPLKAGELVVGKIIGNASFILVVLLLTLAIPLALLQAGQFDAGTIAAQYAGALLLIICFTSIGVLASCLTQQQTLAYIISIGINFILLISGLEKITSSLISPFDLIFLNLSAMEHYRNIIRGVLNIKDVGYFLSASSVACLLAYLTVVKLRSNTRSRGYSKRKAYVVLVVSVLVAVNFILQLFFIQIDLTDDKIFSLSPATVQLASVLKEPVAIKFFSSENLPPQQFSMALDIKDKLRDLSKQSKGKVKVYFKNTDRSDAERFEANLAGIRPVNFNIIRKDEYQLKQGYFGLSVEMDKRRETVPYIESADNFEYQIISLIKRMSRKDRKKVAYLTGHGERDFGGEYAAFKNELLKYFEVGEVEVDKYKVTPIGKKYNVIIIAGSQKWISYDQQKEIARYIRGGGSMLFLLDGIVLDRDAGGTQRNMNSVMRTFQEELGFVVNDDLLYDYKAGQIVGIQNDPTKPQVLYPYWVEASIDQGSKMAGGAFSVTLPWASSVRTAKPGKLKAKFKTILVTSAFTERKTENIRIDISNKPPADIKKVKSYAAGISAEYEGGGRVVVIGDSDFLLDKFVGETPENLTFAANAVDWLSQDETLINIRAKSSSPKRLLFPSENYKLFAKYLNIVLVPLIVAGYGALRLLRRKSQEKSKLKDTN